MKTPYQPIHTLKVFYHPHTKSEPLPVGKLTLNSRRVFFEYNQEFLSLGINLSPLQTSFTNRQYRLSRHLIRRSFWSF